jgi:exopolysaccharide production protein ExoY
MTMSASEKGPFRRNVRAFLASGEPSLSAASRIQVAVQISARPGHPGEDQAATAADCDKVQSVSQQAKVPLRPLGGWPKRLADMTIALVALVLASPVMLAVALLIRATTGGPAIFSHSRVGFNGKPFNCYKFRTMIANSEQALRDYLACDPEAAREWEQNRKLKRDPRITLLGMMLRKSSLDELPQLFNVLRGDMSCVGPRPIVTDELPRYGACADEYLRTRPGLTGLWQVTGRSSMDYSHRVALDTQYVRNWSLWADLVILLRTTVAVMRFDKAS